MYDYEWKKRSFVEALEVEDTVESEAFIRGRAKVWAPADSIAEFREWVRSRRHDIDAITVLLDSPSDFNTGVLAELLVGAAGASTASHHGTTPLSEAGTVRPEARFLQLISKFGRPISRYT